MDYENPKRDKTSGEYILFTDGPLLDINIWEPSITLKDNFPNNNTFVKNFQNNSDDYKNNNKYNKNTNTNNNFNNNKNQFNNNNNNYNSSSGQNFHNKQKNIS